MKNNIQNSNQIIKIAIVLGIFLIIVLSIAKITNSNKTTDNGKIKAVASFYPISQLVKYIGGDKIEITTLIPEGSEPHNYEIKPNDISNLKGADVIFINGVIDQWIYGIDVDRTKIIDLSKSLDSANILKDNLGNTDPHYWQDTNNLIRQAEVISSKLTMLDAANTGAYRLNLIELTNKLDTIKANGKNIMKNCKTNTIITYHRAYDYLAKEYALQVITLLGFGDEGEVSSSSLNQMRSIAKDKQIKYLLVDSMENVAEATKIAQNSSLEILSFATLEGSQNGQTLLDLYQRNLDTLRKALECKTN
jgi:zinc transport system substrate-binding protein